MGGRLREGERLTAAVRRMRVTLPFRVSEARGVRGVGRRDWTGSMLGALTSAGRRRVGTRGK